MRTTPERIALRRASAADVDSLVPLFGAYRAFYRWRPEPAAERAYLRERIARDEAVVFVAEGSGRALGFTLLYPSFSSERMRRIWVLNDLFVAPAARRRGVGARLLRRAYRFARASGAAYLTLETAVDNPAQRLYAAEGWRPDDEFLHFERATGIGRRPPRRVTRPSADVPRRRAGSGSAGSRRRRPPRRDRA
jgi:GNAT superfamily N-acetyltransferase